MENQMSSHWESDVNTIFDLNVDPNDVNHRSKKASVGEDMVKEAMRMGSFLNEEDPLAEADAALDYEIMAVPRPFPDMARPESRESGSRRSREGSSYIKDSVTGDYKASEGDWRGGVTAAQEARELQVKTKKVERVLHERKIEERKQKREMLEHVNFTKDYVADK